MPCALLLQGTISPHARHLLSHLLLCKDPGRRATIDAVCSHPWVTEEGSNTQSEYFVVEAESLAGVSCKAHHFLKICSRSSGSSRWCSSSRSGSSLSTIHQRTRLQQRPEQHSSMQEQQHELTGELPRPVTSLTPASVGAKLGATVNATTRGPRSRASNYACHDESCL